MGQRKARWARWDAVPVVRPGRGARVHDSNKPFDDEDESDRKIWTEKYEFVLPVRDISVLMFLSASLLYNFLRHFLNQTRMQGTSIVPCSIRVSSVAK